MGKYEDIRPGATMAENTPVYPPLPTAPEGTPNIVFCVFDDVGFSDFGCCGDMMYLNNFLMTAHRSSRLRMKSYKSC
jgi:hypothetical protein